MKDKYIILRALCFYLLYQVASATARPKYVIPPLFSKKVAVFSFMMYC